MLNNLSRKTEEIMLSYKTSLDLLGITPDRFTAEDYLVIRKQALSEIMSLERASGTSVVSDDPYREFAENKICANRTSVNKMGKIVKKEEISPNISTKSVINEQILFDSEEEKEDLLSMIFG